ncbi:hypothetical protein U1872_15235 [Sphingomonas sp. RB3P16]|uniref:hypothetical protein n=1 Tax=Parasphingomonas frigoris TaxID=3096163 RepID=UPI002FC62204
MIESYETRSGREAMLGFGPAGGPVAVVALPLFEEANRVRAFAVAICRALARRGVASLLPDVPGQGESVVPLEQCGIRDFSDGYARAVQQELVAGRRPYGVAIRSGALLDTQAALAGRWHLAPQDGASLLRDLKRIKQAGAKPGEILSLDGGAPIEIAGNRLSPDLLSTLPSHALRTAQDGSVRIVRLETDREPADRHVPGAPLWRRAEPDTDLALATILADDIADWIAACDA